MIANRKLGKYVKNQLVEGEKTVNKCVEKMTNLTSAQRNPKEIFSEKHITPMGIAEA